MTIKCEGFVQELVWRSKGMDDGMNVRVLDIKWRIWDWVSRVGGNVNVGVDMPEICLLLRS